MGIVFINYRRDQTAGEARALYNDLVQRLGAGRVFMDVDNIALGRDFREVLQERLQDCEVMLTLIGRQWADARDAAGQRRLEQASDFVRLEIATALKRNVSVTPVLLQDARMPGADLLPEDLKPLAFRNGFEISHQTWESNVQELVSRLGLAPAVPTPAPPSGPSGRSPVPWVGVAVALVAAGAGGVWLATSKDSRPNPPAAPAPSAATAPASGPQPASMQAAPAATEPVTVPVPATVPEPVPALVPEQVPAPVPKPVPSPVPAQSTKPALTPNPAPAPAPVTAAADDAAAISQLVARLVSKEAKDRQDASEVLQREHLRSAEAVRAALAYLPYERFRELGLVAQRARLLNFLLATDDSAWTPELRAQGARAVATVQAQIKANPAAFRAENTERVEALARRLGG